MCNFEKAGLNVRYIQSERSNCWPREDREASWGNALFEGWGKWKVECSKKYGFTNFSKAMINNSGTYFDAFRHRMLPYDDYDWLMDHMTVRNTVDYRIVTHLMLNVDTAGYVFKQLESEGINIRNKKTIMNTLSEYIWLEVVGDHEMTVSKNPELFSSYDPDFIHNMVSYNLGYHTLEFYQTKLSKEKNRWVSRDDLRAETKKLMNQLNGVQDACTFLACMDQYRFTDLNTLLILFRR